MIEESTPLADQLQTETGWKQSDFPLDIYDFVPDIICVYNAEKKQLSYVNKKITEVLGYSFDDLKAWDHDFSKVIFKEDLDQVQKELEKYNDLKDEDSHDYKCRFNCKEGSWRHFHVSGKILKRNNGKPSSLLFVAQDVTERIHSTEEARGLKGLINETEDLLHFGNWTWDIKTNEMKWSKGIFTILGLESKEPTTITKDSYLQYVAEEDIIPFESALSKAIQNKQTFELDYTVVTTKGEEKNVYSKGKIILDGDNEPVKMLGITRCVSEQTELYSSLANYKKMALEKEEFLGHGSWEINYIDNTIEWSDGMYRLFGYNAETDKNKLTIDEQLYKLHMSEEDFNLNSVTRQTDAKGNSYISEYEIKTRNGELKKVEAFGKVIHDRKGKPIKLIGTTRDVTQLRNYERELEKKITELKRSNKDLEDFAYIASHDIQEPLRKIISFSERLKTKYSHDLPDEAKNYLDRIMASTKNARFLIDGLMDFSRLTSEGQSFQKADLNILFQEVKTELELKIEETKTVINAQPLPVIEAVSVQIKQILTNLLLNSIKFRKANVNPLIDIKSKKLSRADVLQYKLDPSRNYFKISISDNGIGFEEEYAEKIFEMFQRLHSKAEYPGAGIGLALCKKITENHNGTIYANSELGKGTTFFVILPEIQ
jgi:PAS domain S-box-containing protein